MSGDPNHTFELYKLEYERAATRYEDIYKAVWTNFSYLAAVSGAILAFGGDKFGIEPLVVVASIPLLFWYWATFEPLDTYADDAVNRLSEIEKELNGRFGTDLRHYTQFRENREQMQSPYQSGSIKIWLILIFILGAFAGSAILRKVCKVWQTGTSQKLFWLFFILGLAITIALALKSLVNTEKLRVRRMVKLFSVLLHIVVVAFILFYLFRLGGVPVLDQKQEEIKTVSITLNDGKGEVKLTEIDLDKLNEIIMNLGKKTNEGSSTEGEKPK